MRKTARGIPIPIRTLTGSAPKLDPPTSNWDYGDSAGVHPISETRKLR
jgi:hypothetical protein